MALLALLGSAVSGLHAQQRVPAGYEEGIFDVVAAGLPQSSVPVLVTPRGKFLLPVQRILDPLAVPFRLAADSGVLRVARPGGAGTATLWLNEPRRLEAAAMAPLDSDDVHVDGPTVFVAANRLAELIEGVIDVDVGTPSIRRMRCPFAHAPERACWSGAWVGRCDVPPRPRPSTSVAAWA
jgi:hypothetical protein